MFLIAATETKSTTEVGGLPCKTSKVLWNVCPLLKDLAQVSPLLVVVSVPHVLAVQRIPLAVEV